MVYIYCLKPGDWFTLLGAIGSILAVITALWIALSQERKIQKRINEENKNIGKMICALLQQSNTLITTFVAEGYQNCIDNLEKDDVSVPAMKLFPMTGIKKLDQLNPDILYRVFKYYNLTDEEYIKFVISLDSVSTNIEYGLKNYLQTSSNAANLRNEFFDSFNELSIMFVFVIRKYRMSSKKNDSVSTSLELIAYQFMKYEKTENMQYYKDAFVDTIQATVACINEEDEKYLEIFNQTRKLNSIYRTLQKSNKLYRESLEKDKKIIADDIKIIEKIHEKLRKKIPMRS